MKQWIKRWSPVMFGLGLGFFLAGLLWLSRGASEMSRAEVEKRARDLGMGYREQFVLFASDVQTSRPVTVAPGVSAGQPAPLSSVEVIVPPGATLQAVAQLLAQAGVVGDTGEFVSQVAQMGLASRLRAGTYSFPAGANLELVISQLTK